LEKQQGGTFLKIFMKIWGTSKPVGRNGGKQKFIVNPKHLELSGEAFFKFKI
jgi:hypothetical protein